MIYGFTEVPNFRTEKKEIVSIDGLYNLADAIIIRACDDYNAKDITIREYDIEKFLRSDWALVLMRGCCNADKIIDHLREVKSLGKSEVCT